MIVAGGGVRASGAAAELVALAEALQIPVATSLNGKDVIPGNHPLAVGVVGTYSRESANRVVNGADLVCFIGSETGGMTTHFWAVPKIGTPAIQIDIDPEALGRNYPLLAGVNGDAKVDARAHARGGRPRQRRQAQGLGRGGAEDLQGMGGEVQVRAHLRRRADPPRAHLRRAHPARAGQRHRRGRHRPCRHVDGRHVRSHQSRAKLHAQRRPSRLGVPGRARRQMRVPRPPRGHLHRRRRASGTTSPRSRPPRAGASTPSPWSTTTASGNQSKRGFDRVYGGTQTEQAREMWTFSKVNFARIAEDMGAVGIRVEKPADIGPAIAQALEGEPSGDHRCRDRHRRARAAGGELILSGCLGRALMREFREVCQSCLSFRGAPQARARIHPAGDYRFRAPSLRSRWIDSGGAGHRRGSVAGPRNDTVSVAEA